MWSEEQGRRVVGHPTTHCTKRATIWPPSGGHATVRFMSLASPTEITWGDRSGQSIFSRPKPIDISAIRRAGYTSLDFDLENEDEDPELGRPLVQDPVLFDVRDEEQPTRMSDMPLATQALHDRDDEDVWAELG